MDEIKGCFYKLKTQLFLGYLVTFALIALMMLGVMYSGVKQLMISQIGQGRVDVLKQVSERSNTIKNSIITISNLYRYDTRVYEYFSEESTANDDEKQIYLNNLKKNYDQVFHEIDIAYDVILMGNQGFRYSSLSKDRYDFKSLENQLWYRRSFDEEGDILFISSFKEQFLHEKREGDRYVFSAFRKILSPKGQELGTLMVNIDEKYLERLYSALSGQNNYIYMFDKKGNIVSSKDKSLLGLNYIGVDNFKNMYGENQYHIINKLGEDYLLSHYYDSQTGWTIVEEMPCSQIFAPLYQALQFLLGALVLCLMLAFGISYYMAGRISRPIRKLCHSMNQVKRGDFEVISDVDGYEEIIQLKDSFNEMECEIKKLLERVKQKEINKRRAEMDFLRAQINPHFLYNTLFSIQCLIEIHKNHQAVQMMAAFIDLLKMTLSVDKDLISLEEELESTRKYLILQQIRYGDKIHFEYETETAASVCLVPPLIIQPIVENAIFHGLEPKAEEGLIVITSALEEDQLLITISDDGIGIKEEELEQLNQHMNSDIRKYARSIGIINVQNRIRINFGESYGAVVTSEPGVGTTVTLVLPVTPEPTGYDTDKE